MLIISNDDQIYNSLENLSKEFGCDYSIFKNSKDPLDIVSEVLSKNSTLVILDDDFIAPNSIRLLETIKKVNPKLSIIFITSNLSIELGRAINNIGVTFYLIKPIDTLNLREFINSVRTQNQNLLY
ncbi:MAG: response regulator [Ignavibacteriae bacterium]|nr:response regulator [Ignavibacteriota bacterium]